MTTETDIDVCIATFKRPAMLAKLLASLLDQDLGGLALHIIVIDNDHEQSARPIVERFCTRRHMDILYDVEPEQNLALARNRALQHVRSEYFAFIDDDESVCNIWLRAFLQSLIRYKADIAFGPVICTLPANAPNWAMQSFRRPRRHTGEPVPFGATNNVMARRKILDDPHLRFDPEFGLTGGEDTDFFYRQHLAGRRLIWCDEAMVSESVPETRLTLSWIRRRGFRGGQTYQRIFVARYSALKKAAWFVFKTAQLVGGIFAAPIVRCVSYPAYVALTVRIAGASGQLSRCFSGANFEEYNRRRYQ